MRKGIRNFFISKLYKFIVPPSEWRLTIIILAGIFFGLSLFIFYISNAASYLSDNPETCTNCHVMNPQFATWERGSHGRVANCNDCHVPHDNFFNKYLFKAKDGLRHATIFTMRWEPQVIQIKEAGKNVVQQNCIRCHQNIVHKVSIKNVTFNNYVEGEGLLCWSCHRETPHGRVNSLSSTPYARVPQLTPVYPEWLKDFVNSKNK
jgi:cytochrome c nitrite reductase small subunit